MFYWFFKEIKNNRNVYSIFACPSLKDYATVKLYLKKNRFRASYSFKNML